MDELCEIAVVWGVVGEWFRIRTAKHSATVALRCVYSN